MLSLPEFLRGLIVKVKTIRDKTNILGGDNKDSAVDSVDRLTKFEKNMEKLEDILHSPKETEFIVVTIATEVAFAETKVSSFSMS
jgi:anion-transporting  ArsA/GET3 family ATPase